MTDFSAAFANAYDLLIHLDSNLLEIIVLSLKVTFVALCLACLISLPLAALLAVKPFFGRQLIIILCNTLMGLPPVVVGLVVYMLLSAAGPLGSWQLLYTPSAMILAQVILITPIITALSTQILTTLFNEYRATLAAMHATFWQTLTTVLWDSRYLLLTAMLAGLGRAMAEVGAVMIVGGNINHVTRVMTTAIALETARGELAMALGLGFILLILSLLINGLLLWAKTLENHLAAV